ncbi:MAG: hypothetical protein HY676_04460 [Chloroflexi bacterium]|nr:hypothetical protein [Chloroflexota bacterium]
MKRRTTGARLTPPIRSAPRKPYQWGFPTKKIDRSQLLLPMGLLAFLTTVALTLIFVVVVRGPDTHASLWEEADPSYVRTQQQFVTYLPGPEVPPQETSPTSPLPTPSPGSTPTPVVLGEVSFSQDILPIFKANCVGCHGAGVAMKGVNLSSYQALTSSLPAGEPLFVSGQPEGSLLVKVLRGEGGISMPPGGPLSEEKILAIEEWIRKGALDN